MMQAQALAAQKRLVYRGPELCVSGQIHSHKWFIE